MPTVKFKLPNSVAKMLNDVGEHLKHSSRFSLPDGLKNYVSSVVAFYAENFADELQGSATFFRARIHGVDQLKAYSSTKMGAPPKGTASSGRINPEGISYLYIADSKDTAIAEVRPWKGAVVSVGKFTLSTKCKVVDLSQMKSGKLGSNPLEWLGHQLFSQILIQRYFSAPAHSQDRLAYLPSQYIAEQFKNNGFHAIQYPSVLHDGGHNVALFDSESAECKQVEVVRVRGVQYEYE